MSKAHSRLSPSAAERWLACPASLQHDTGEDQPSQYAAEGTVAHGLANECWLLGIDPAACLGEVRSADGFDVEVTQEMVDAVSIYLRHLVQFSDGGEIGTELRLVHRTVDGFGGTIDALISDRSREIHIVDFKYGAGLAVEAERNPQLSSYAILALDRLNLDAAPVTLTVIQPRAVHPDGPVRSWPAPAEYLEDFLRRVAEVASGGRRDELHAGAWCRWCPARTQCPELHELTLQTAKREFSAPVMTPELASQFLDRRKAVEAFFDAVEQWAHGQLEKGIEIPGYKLVDIYGNRRWAFAPSEIERRCRNRKFGKKQIYATELMSPAQLEKVVGKELVASLVERPHKGTTVVPLSDRREAVKRLAAADEFAGLEVL